MIHQTAIVSPHAEIGSGVTIGPYSIIGDGVEIGAETRIGAHVVIAGPTRIGRHCTIFPFASIGEVPQDLKFKGERTEVVIGDHNTIREYVTINRGTQGGGGITAIGDNNLLMAYCHVAHDCLLGNGIIMSNGVNLAGHISIEDCAVIGGMVGVQQFVRIGKYAMIGGMSGVPQDVPPYVIATGERTKLSGLNIIGLKRHGFTAETISELKAAYKILFRSGLTTQKAVQRIEEEGLHSADVQYLVRFVLTAERGVLRK